MADAQTLSTLDDIAMFVLDLDPNDFMGLANLQGALGALAEADAWPEAANAQAQRATHAIEQIILGDGGDTTAAVARIGESVERVQNVLYAIENGQDLPVYEDAVDETTEDTAADGDATSESADVDTRTAQEISDTVTEIVASDPVLIGEFITECMDHLTAAEGSLLDLEANPEDSDAVNAVFRAFHTIKGTAGFIDLSDIQTVAHHAETLLDRARSGEIRLTGGYADLALESADALKQMIENLQDVLGGEPFLLPKELTELMDKLKAPEKMGVTAETTVGEPVIPRLGDMLVAEEKVEREDVEVAVRDQGDTPIGQALVKMGATSAPEVAKTLRKQKQMARVSDTTVRVSTDRLDRLINMVGELVITQTMVAQSDTMVEAEDRGLLQNISQLGKITRELQGLSMSMRMVPLKATFQKMARLVRDLGRKSGKKVRFVTEGEDTEIDRNMVEAINDPLVHMVRNSLDHGIEMPTDRVAKGKDETGTVTLRAYHAAGSVVIELEDDGKGLDLDAIHAKAIERGTVEAGREMSDNEIYKLIFGAGLSTAKKVTNVSGRGVGMDVVKRNIDSLRGRIDITSQKDRGTIIAVRVPLTLAIIDGMLLRVGEHRYILPTVSIRQAFRPQPADLSTVTGKGELVNLRGELIPVFRISRLFNVDTDNEKLEESLLVVAEANDEHCAFVVDELLGQQQVVIKTLGEGLGSVAGISGAAILGDGRVGLILDVSGMLDIARGGHGVEGEAAQAV